MPCKRDYRPRIYARHNSPDGVVGIVGGRELLVGGGVLAAVLLLGLVLLDADLLVGVLAAAVLARLGPRAPVAHRLERTVIDVHVHFHYGAPNKRERDSRVGG